jgi:hypothetical protein
MQCYYTHAVCNDTLYSRHGSLIRAADKDVSPPSTDSLIALLLHPDLRHHSVSAQSQSVGSGPEKEKTVPPPPDHNNNRRGSHRTDQLPREERIRVRDVNVLLADQALALFQVSKCSSLHAI